MTKRWSYSAGEWGTNRIRVFERGRSGLLYVEFYERDGDRLVKRKVSLGHRDRARARRQVDQMAKRADSVDLPPLDLTLEQLFDIYLREVSGTKAANTARHDHACVAMFTRVFGGKRKARSLDIRDWQRFIELRRTGQISPNGHGRPVGDRQVEYDLKTLRAMLNWATNARVNGRALLERNPVGGFPLPKEESPHRPVFTEAEYEAILAVADAVDWRFTLALVLAHETGHRISAIARLRWTDIDLESGTILWRKENDKQGYEHQVPVSRLALEALKTARQMDPSLGDRWVFPSPRNPTKPCCRETLTKWLRAACTRAGVSRERGQGFHSLRRKFATDLRNAPLKVVAELGGWKSTRTVLDCYQLPDHEALRSALAIRPRIRPTRGQGTRPIRSTSGVTA
jgi:integrase